MRKDSGATLLEVLIAVMILAFAGTVLIGGLFMSKVVSDKSTQKREALAQLSAVVQELNSVPFVPCSTSSDEVYATPEPTTSSNLYPVELKVEVLDEATDGWVSCTANSGSPSRGIQRITISTQVNGQTYSQVMVKTRG